MEAKPDVIKSPADDRTYRVIALENGLRAVLINDGDTDKAAAALNVHIGSMSDPDDFPGLAHFCEHMLFLGTEKYPGENDYTSYLSEHGGFSNAFTSSADTNFYFDVAHDHLEGALDRFCQFFYSPLFNQDCTDREINAVDAENDKNLKSDAWRLHQLDKATSDPSHPYSKFSTGNKATLQDLPAEKGLDTRAALLDFHSTYYSSHMMGLAVLGRESLDQLEMYVRDRFSSVERKDVEAPVYKAHPHSGDALQKYIEVVPVKELQRMTMSFPIRDHTMDYTSQPGHCLAHLLGHEGKASLLSLLKELGYANGLSAGDYGGEIGTYSFFKIAIDLTEDGLDNIDAIIEAVFQYIAMLKEKDLPTWIFEECRDLYKVAFQFLDKAWPSSYCSSLAADVLTYAADDLLCAHYKLNEFRPDLMNEILAKMTPDLLRVCVVSKQFEADDNLTEPVYGTRYKVRQLTEAQLKRWRDVSLSDKLQLPSPNTFIATDFTIQPLPTGQSAVEPGGVSTVYPTMIRDNGFAKLWHKQDDVFRLPKASISVALISPVAYVDPAHCNMTRLVSDMMKDSFVEFAYDAELAGIGFSCNNTIYGVDFSVNGYSEKLVAFLCALVERLATLNVDPGRFPMVKDQYRRSLASFKSSQPTSLSGYEFRSIVSEKIWSHALRLDALDGITYDQIQAFQSELLRRCHLEILVHGNLTAHQAIAAVDQIEAVLKSNCGSSGLLPAELTPQRHLRLDPSEDVRARAVTSTHHMHCVQMYFQVGLEADETDVELMLFLQIIKENFFETLRTQEQLGYIVHSGQHCLFGATGVTMIIQSEKSASYVDTRIRQFVDAMDEYISGLTDEQYSNHANALVNTLLDKPKTLTDEARGYWKEILAHTYDFGWEARYTALIKTLPKQRVLDFYRARIKSTGKLRSRITVWVEPEPKPADTVPTPGDDPNATVPGEEIVLKNMDDTAPVVESDAPGVLAERAPVELAGPEDILQFQRSHALYPAPVVTGLRAN